MKNFSARLLIVLAVLFIGAIYTIPTFNIGIWPHKKINLGLDLQGGMHLVLEVETDKAVQETIDRLAYQIKNDLKSKRLDFLEVAPVDKNKIIVKAKKDNADKIEKFLEDDYKDLNLEKHSVNDTVSSYILYYPSKELAHMKKMAVEQALETIRNRIDQFGVSEPDIRMQGENSILIQLPGIKDTERAKKLIGDTALLEFKLVDNNHDINSVLRGKEVPGLEILYDAEDSKQPYLLQKNALLTGSYLTDAKVQIDSKYNEPYVLIELDRKGARIFEKITEENVHRRLAIVLDNRVYTAPVIQEKISGGVARITGSFNTETAHDLSIALRAGALPAPVKIIEERTVGPSLGADSIHKGIMSMWIGGLVVLLFMALYYKVSGLIADAALILNILLIAGGLAFFQATLTLPGIAGIILTIGMAVDSNVLIFERIREELKVGKTSKAAIGAGYDKAALTILDANVTTLIAALVLFQFGTGPVKGFAVTLSLGVLSSVFTALVVARLISDYVFSKIKISI